MVYIKITLSQLIIMNVAKGARSYAYFTPFSFPVLILLVMSKSTLSLTDHSDIIGLLPHEFWILAIGFNRLHRLTPLELHLVPALFVTGIWILIQCK
ncbi:hypothetical protein BYT27DRAFT_7203689 [Phlegmacium glaucopus]|nr:hypothetical protein BYT27DRAFT_7203689 [Phlegmacium glaucopus]